MTDAYFAGSVQCTLSEPSFLKVELYYKLYYHLFLEASARGLSVSDLATQLLKTHLGGGDILSKLKKLSEDYPKLATPEKAAILVLANAMTVVLLKKDFEEKKLGKMGTVYA
jgi:hypothetical protein